MVWTARVTGKSRNGFNITATVQFTDGTDTLSETIGGPNVADDNAIALYCTKRIAMLQAQDDQLTALTIGSVTLLDSIPDTISPEQKALMQARAALSDAVFLAQAKAVDDPGVQSALSDFTDAKTQVDSIVAEKALGLQTVVAPT